LGNLGEQRFNGGGEFCDGHGSNQRREAGEDAPGNDD